MSEETAKIRDKFKNCLLSSLGANGNKGYNAKEFCRLFSEDWYENILDYAHRLGFSTQNPASDILNLLKSFPEQVIINELPDGSVHLRPVATDDIKENMALIDKTNREMDKIKYIRESKAKQRNQMNLPNPNMIPVQNQQPPAIRLAQIPPHLQSIPMTMAPPPGFHQIPPPPIQPQFPPSSAWAIIGGQQQIPFPPPPGQQPRFFSMPPAPRQPQQQQQLRPVYQRNQPPPQVKAQSRSSLPPPNLPGGSKNANLVPLGQVRRPFVVNKFSAQELIDIYSQQQQQRSSNSSKQNGHVPASNQKKNARPVVNDFGDVVVQPPKAKNKIEINIRQQPATASSSSSNSQQPTMMNGHIGESKNWAEDFRVPPSNEASGKGSLVGSRERIDIWAEPSDFEDEDEDDGEEMFYDSESEWECPLEMDKEWAEDNEECTAFIDEMQQWAPPTIPSDLYRLIHLFRLNDGVYSSAKMEKLQTAYSNAFRADLTTKEWNRLLGSEETIKIVKDRFKRCKWPASEMFKIAEKEKTYSYEIRLLRALTDAVADPTIFVGQNAPSSSASAAPTPGSSRPRSQVQPSPISSIVGGGAHQMQSPTTSGRNSSSIPPPPSSLPSPIPSTNGGGGGQGPSTTNSKDFDQFAELAIFAQQLLFKAKNGPRKPLNQLFGRIKAMAHPQQFSEILLETQTAFLGYLRLFSESFRIEFQCDGIFVTAMNVQPNSQNCTFPTDSSLFYNNSDLHRGERHKVIMVDYKSPDVCVTLQLSQIFKNFQELLSEYKQILEDIREPPFENCLPNQRVFFLDAANKSLCRGQFIRHDGEERTIIRDIDNGRERYILRKHIFQLPNNFPNWRFPSCHFSAKFVDADEAKLKQLWSQANCEFTVDIVEVLPNFCRVRLAADQ